MAVRRAMLSIGNMPELVAQNWLEFSETLEKSGKLTSAQIALRNAEVAGLNKNQALLQECLILAKSGSVNRALALLEPGYPNFNPTLTQFNPNLTQFKPNMKQFNQKHVTI